VSVFLSAGACLCPANERAAALRPVRDNPGQRELRELRRNGGHALGLLEGVNAADGVLVVVGHHFTPVWYQQRVNQTISLQFLYHYLLQYLLAPE
jgi:hypothetical protein